MSDWPHTMKPGLWGEQFVPPALTKREYFAALAEGPHVDATPEAVADSLGIACLPPSASRSEWFAWWRRAEALWKVAEADALIAALNAEPQS